MTLLWGFLSPSPPSLRFHHCAAAGQYLVHQRDFSDFSSICFHMCISRKGSEWQGHRICAWETWVQLPAGAGGSGVMYGCSALQLWNVRAFSACLIWAYHEGIYEDWKTLRAKVTWIIPFLKIESPAKRWEVFLLSHIGEASAAPVSHSARHARDCSLLADTGHMADFGCWTPWAASPLFARLTIGCDDLFWSIFSSSAFTSVFLQSRRCP